MEMKLRMEKKMVRRLETAGKHALPAAGPLAGLVHMILLPTIGILAFVLSGIRRLSTLLQNAVTSRSAELK